MSEIRQFNDAMQIYEDCEVCLSPLISDQAKAFFALVLCKKGTNRQNTKSGADSNVVHAKTENRSDKKRTHLFIYRMTSDTGFAPCVDHGLLTLACCKGGQIRQGKVIHTGLRHKIGSKDKVNYVIEDVYILGTYHDKFLYLAKVNEVMTMQKYFSRKTAGRTDDIYSVENGKLVRNEYLREEKVHIEPDRIKKDLAGDYVLSSVEYVYLGRDAVFIDIVAENNARFQETKYYCGEKAEQIIAACMKYKDGRRHTPTNPYPKHGGCQ